MVEAKYGQTERSIKQIGPITVLQLLGGVIPRQDQLENIPEYRRLAKTKLHTFIVEDPTADTTDYIFAADPMKGYEINGLFHFAAPSKIFGYDAGDIRMDWTNLFADPTHQKRLEAHRRIPGFILFETGREQILDVLGSSDKLLTPVIHLRKTKESLVWVFDELDEELVGKMKATHLGNDSFPLPILGPCLVAGYSPEITKGWANKNGQRGYTDKTGIRQELDRNQLKTWEQLKLYL